MLGQNTFPAHRLPGEMPVENEVAAGEGSSDDDSKSRQGFGACDDMSVASAEDLEDEEEALQNPTLPPVPSGGNVPRQAIASDSESESASSSGSVNVAKPASAISPVSRLRPLKRWASDTLTGQGAGFSSGLAQSSTGVQEAALTHHQAQIDILTCEVPDCTHTSKDSRLSIVRK